jgi:glycosyltransferase involved in cell wall biosynthesis
MNNISAPPRRLRVCRVVTVPITFATLLNRQIRYIADAGIDLTIVSSPGAELDLFHTVPVRCYPILMAREPAPLRDLRSLIALTRFLHRERFDIVHSSTPKAGLLTALAGFLARVPVRIHTFTGQPWMNMRGILRRLIRAFDFVIGRLDTHLYADSHSQRDFLIAEGLITADKIRVLGDGSISGVDLQRYDQSHLTGARNERRAQLEIPATATVIVFVGRVNRDKGIVELVDAFQILRAQHADLHLILVGPLEPEHDPLPARTLEQISANPFIHAVGFQTKPEEYLALADIFCLPSYREGFGSAAIEAGALYLPSVVTRMTGLTDAVVDGETGLIVPPKDGPGLVRALTQLIESPDLRRRMGQAAHQRVVRSFDANKINQLVVDEYLTLANRI